MEFKTIMVGKGSDISPTRTVEALEIDGLGCILIVSDKYKNAIGNVLSTSQSMLLIHDVHIEETKDDSGVVVKREIRKNDNYLAE